jgi:hypothetical protein
MFSTQMMQVLHGAGVNNVRVLSRVFGQGLYCARTYCGAIAALLALQLLLRLPVHMSSDAVRPR